MTGGLRAVFGTMTKPLQAARAAANGLFAGGLAHTGFHTDPSLLDASGGFPVLYADDLSMDRTRERLDHRCIRDVVFKYHASCYGTQETITATYRYACCIHNRYNQSHGYTHPKKKK